MLKKVIFSNLQGGMPGKFSKGRHVFSLTLVACVMCALIVSCEDDDLKSDEGHGFDLSRPFSLQEFFPQDGRFLERVMLVGDNFPTNPDYVRVYFNDRLAAITGIGSAGTHMTAMAPRLPGGDTIPAPGYSFLESPFRRVDISIVVDIPGEYYDSLSYGRLVDRFFVYEQTTSSTTIAGNGRGNGCGQLQGGTLAEAIFQPILLCADDKGNIFVSTRPNGIVGGNINGCSQDHNAAQHGFLRINEEEDIVEILHSWTGGSIFGSPTVRLDGSIVVPHEGQMLAFEEYRPEDNYSRRQRNFSWDLRSQSMGTNREIRPHRPPNNYKKLVVSHPVTGTLYTRYFYTVVKIDPLELVCEVIANDNLGVDVFGMAFFSTRPGFFDYPLYDNDYEYDEDGNLIMEADGITPKLLVPLAQMPVRYLLYMTAGRGGDTPALSGIHVVDISYADNPNLAKDEVARKIEESFRPASSLDRGHRDGRLEFAQFNNPSQIYFDETDESMWVADYENHCIRRIYRRPGDPQGSLMVETVLGIPGSFGSEDGARGDARFRNPSGIAVAPDGTVYVADCGNNRIRKISRN